MGGRQYSHHRLVRQQDDVLLVLRGHLMDAIHDVGIRMCCMVSIDVQTTLKTSLISSPSSPVLARSHRCRPPCHRRRRSPKIQPCYRDSARSASVRKRPRGRPLVSSETALFVLVPCAYTASVTCLMKVAKAIPEAHRSSRLITPLTGQGSASLASTNSTTVIHSASGTSSASTNDKLAQAK